MKGYVVPFIAAFLISGVIFLAVDIAIMNLQGLSLIYHP